MKQLIIAKIFGNLQHCIKNFMTISKYLNNLREKTSNKFNILDIGAHQGEFSTLCKSIWAEAYILMIEGNKNCKSFLENLPFDYRIALLSDCDKELTFYVNKENPTCTGSSYYKELSEPYEDCFEFKVNSTTLDKTLKNFKKKFDLIKLDTQGSEIDIIKGGLKTVESASYIIMEASKIPYNTDAPLFDEVIDYMSSIGFSNFEVIDEHFHPVHGRKIKYGELFQVDVVFTKKDI